jgi:hypothetical protein
VRAAALIWERERDAADALARQIAEAEQLLASLASQDAGPPPPPQWDTIQLVKMLLSGKEYMLFKNRGRNTGGALRLDITELMIILTNAVEVGRCTIACFWAASICADI